MLIWIICRAIGGQPFIVAIMGIMATVIEQPHEYPFNCPSPGNHLESLTFLVGRRFQVDFVHLLQITYPLFKPLIRISTIDHILRGRLTLSAKLPH
jgi:hypothetical protein